MKKRIVCVLLALIMLVGLVPATAISASAANYSTSERAITVLKQMEGYSKYCNSNGYTTWYIGGSYGSTASLPIATKIEVDSILIQGSENPVSGGAVYDALSSKIQEISTDGEAVSPNVLYVITNNQG